MSTKAEDGTAAKAEDGTAAKVEDETAAEDESPPCWSFLCGTDNAALRRLWDEHEDHPHFFRRMDIAEDGGLSEVDHLLNINIATRFFFAGMAIASIVMNMYFMFIYNLRYLASSDTHFTQEQTHEVLLFHLATRAFGGDKELAPKTIVALYELILFVLIIGQSGFFMIRGYLKRKNDQPQSWDDTAFFFFNMLPVISSFSAMGSLYYVVPTILVPDFTVQVKRLLKRREDDKTALRIGWPMFKFTVIRLVYLVVGFDAFLVKFRAAANDYVTPSDTSNQAVLFALIGSGAFLNQILGVMKVNRHTKKRLLVYIFGGEDGYINSKERLRQEAWHAMLAQKIWLAANKRGKGVLMRQVWFVAMMLSYSDHDFQSLTLNEKAKNKQLLTQAASLPAQPAQDPSKLSKVAPEVSPPLVEERETA